MREDLYRIVHTNPPTASDFLSLAALGRPRPTHINLQEWAGISVWDTRAAAVDTARKFPRHGSWIARLDLTGTAMPIQQTYGVGHYTAWGDPVDFLPFVVTVTHREEA